MFFFLHTSNKFAMQYNPLMELRLIFHKTLLKRNWKTGHFKLIYLAVFQQLRKLYLELKGRGGKFVLFLSLFLSVHINFQYKLNSHRSLFIETFYLFFSIALLIFSHLQFQCFFLWFLFINLLNMCNWILSSAVPSFVSNFNSRKNEQTLIFFDL